MTRPIYLDYNGTTPHDPAVIEAMRPFLETEFGNPSSSHHYGKTANRALNTARRQVAQILNCEPGEVLFTSGGTESNNHAILGVARANRHMGNHIITSAVEHPAVLEVCRYLAADGFKITCLPVDTRGMVQVAAVEKEIRPETILITIMHANNEVGTIQPIDRIAALAKANRIFLHTDAAQSVGKINTDVNALGVDLLSVAGHKIYAPKGIGALYIRDPLALEKFCHGAGQEGGRRAGTENVLAIVGLGKACEIAARDLRKNMSQMRRLRDKLHQGLMERLENVRLNGHLEKRLPNTLSPAFKGLEANRILSEISVDVAASAGAACHSDTVQISHVLEAMAVPLDWAKGTLRFSLGRMTTAREIDKTVEITAAAVKRLGGK